MKIAGIILAGGKGTRFDGANKALLMLGDRPLVSHVADRLKPQASITGINANRDLQQFLNIEFKLPIVADAIGGNLGPLDGVLGAMLFASKNSCTHALTVSVDTPFIPLDLAEKLSEISKDRIVIASSHGRVHGACGLWPVTQIAMLNTFINSGKHLKVMDYLNEVGFEKMAFAGDSPDPFFNINTPDDLAAATRWL